MRVPSGPTRTRSYLYHNSDYRPQPLRMVVLELTSFSGCSGRGKLRLRYFRASLATARAGETTAASSRPATKKKPQQGKRAPRNSSCPPTARGIRSGICRTGAAGGDAVPPFPQGELWNRNQPTLLSDRSAILKAIGIKPKRNWKPESDSPGTDNQLGDRTADRPAPVPLPCSRCCAFAAPPASQSAMAAPRALCPPRPANPRISALEGGAARPARAGRTVVGPRAVTSAVRAGRAEGGCGGGDNGPVTSRCGAVRVSRWLRVASRCGVASKEILFTAPFEP